LHFAHCICVLHMFSLFLLTFPACVNIDDVPLFTKSSAPPMQQLNAGFISNMVKVDG
jgi:hypothetical protein